jgi:hypothetical protein
MTEIITSSPNDRNLLVPLGSNVSIPPFKTVLVPLSEPSGPTIRTVTGPTFQHRHSPTFQEHPVTPAITDGDYRNADFTLLGNPKWKV